MSRGYCTTPPSCMSRVDCQPHFRYPGLARSHSDLTGGTPGAAGSITQASGAIATSLLLTTAAGAVLSQGAVAATPSGFMSNLVQNLATNWASFMTIFNPDAFGNANKLLFAQWVPTQGTRFCYVPWDTDPNAASL